VSTPTGSGRGDECPREPHPADTGPQEGVARPAGQASRAANRACNGHHLYVLDQLIFVLRAALHLEGGLLAHGLATVGALAVFVLVCSAFCFWSPAKSFKVARGLPCKSRRSAPASGRWRGRDGRRSAGADHSRTCAGVCHEQREHERPCLANHTFDKPSKPHCKTKNS
jgi:hypothetical protein